MTETEVKLFELVRDGLDRDAAEAQAAAAADALSAIEQRYAVASRVARWAARRAGLDVTGLAAQIMTDPKIEQDTSAVWAALTSGQHSAVKTAAREAFARLVTGSEVWDRSIWASLQPPLAVDPGAEPGQVVAPELCESCSKRMTQARAEGKAGIVLCGACAKRVNPSDDPDLARNLYDTAPCYVCGGPRHSHDGPGQNHEFEAR